MNVVRTLVIDSEELGDDLLRKLNAYYTDNSQRMINNNSYTRYPFTGDLGDDDFDTIPELIIFLKEARILTVNDYCFIIHWNW